MSTTVEYRLFGFLIWSVTRTTSVTEEEAVYTRMSERFANEMRSELGLVKR